MSQSKYNQQAFDSAVKKYQSQLKPFKVKGKVFMLMFEESNEKAFLTLAPLSRALHEMGADVSAVGYGEDKGGMQIQFDAYALYDAMKNGVQNEKTDALKAFIAEAEKKFQGKFERLFKAPEFLMQADASGFTQLTDGKALVLPYDTAWYKPYRWKELLETGRIIWKQLYNLKKGEYVSLNFDLIPKQKDLLVPLEDHLDAYPITMSMKETAKKYGTVTMGSATMRLSQLDEANRISELKATLLGCHLSQDFDEPIFKAFKPLASILDTSRFRIARSNFGINGRGYYGRHLFGELYGYPTTDGKSRWHTPAQMLYKLGFYPQTAHDSRKPQSRIGFTSTLPLDIYIKTNKINWLAMARKDMVLRKLFHKCSKIVVKANKGFAGYKTDFEVGLVKPNGEHRVALGSDICIRDFYDLPYLKEKGIYAGTMANIPGGECFTTPEYVHGTIVGDVVINVDQSYVLSKKNPFVIVSDKEKGYKVVAAPKDILKKFKERKAESWKRIIEMEKHKSAPADLIEMKKKRFELIGEYAINTNPKAELCAYLIVNEKIANMMHVAMGSGFEPDTATEYHMDVVFDAPGQEIDCYGIDMKTGKQHWILKKGKSVLFKD